MAITVKQIQEASARMTDQDMADLCTSVVEDTLRPAFAQIADLASTTRRAMIDAMQAEVLRAMLQLYFYRCIEERPIRTLAPLSWPLLAGTHR